MPQTRPNGAVVPTNPDNFQSWTNDLATLADSLNVVVKVANQSARDALTKTWGLVVSRQDLGGTLEVCDGTSWFLVGGGLVAETDYTTVSGGATSLQVIANIASVTFKANRWYEVFAHGGLQNTTANTIALAHLHTDSVSNAANNVTGLTELMGYNVPTTVANQTYRFHLSRKIKYSSDTTVQIKVTCEPQIGGGSVSAAGGSTWPLQLGIIDLGMGTV